MNDGHGLDKFYTMRRFIGKLTTFGISAECTRLQVLVSVMTNAEMEMYIARLEAVDKWAKDNEQKIKDGL